MTEPNEPTGHEPTGHEPDEHGASASGGTSGAAGPASAPVGWLPRAAEALFGEGASAAEAYGLLTVDVPAASWIPALEAARDTLGCTFFDWLSAVDEPGTGFQVCAHLVALPAAGGEVHRLVLRTTVPHETPALPTATGVYAGAAWHERETHEMFGLDFTGHPHLVPLLLPDTFEGHPLRKDFVLAARVAKAWPGAKEPGESGHGGPKRRQMLPPGVPDPNEWGPLKGQLPPVPSRPARGRAGGAAGRAAGDRPARRTRSASTGSASQREGAAAPETAATPDTGAETKPAPEPEAKPEAGTGPEAETKPAPEPAAPETEPAPEAHAAAEAERDAEAAPGPRAADAPWHDARPAFEEGGGADAEQPGRESGDGTTEGGA